MLIASLPSAAPSTPPFPATGGPSTGVTGDVAAGPALAPQLDATGFEALVQGTPLTKIGATKVAVADSKTLLPLWTDGAPGSDLAQALAASLSIQAPQPLAPQTVAPSDAGPVGGGSPTTAALSLAVPFAPHLATAKSGVIASPEPSAQAEAPSPAGDQSPATAAPTVVIPFAPNLAAAKSGLIADPKPSAQTDRPGPAGSESSTTAPPTGVVPFAPTLVTAKPGFLADTAPSAQTGPPGSPSSPAIARQRAPADPAAIAASVLSPRPASRVNAAAASAARPITNALQAAAAAPAAPGAAPVPNRSSAPAPTAPADPLPSPGLDLATSEGLSPILKDPSPSLKPALRAVSGQTPVSRPSTPQTPAVAAADGVVQTAAARAAPAVDQAQALAPPALLAATAAPDNPLGLVQAPAQPFGQPQGQLRPLVTSGSNRAPAATAKSSPSSSAQPATPAIQNTAPDQALALVGTGSLTTAKDQDGDKAPGGQAPPADDARTVPAAPAPDGSAVAGSIQAQAAAPQPVLAKVDARTVSQLSAQIVQSVKGNKSSFDLTLHPEGLGDVQVKVSVDRTGAVTASMSFNNPQAAAELGARAGDLRDALTQAGFTVADNGLSFNLGGQGQSGANPGAWAEASQLNAGRAFLAARDNSEDLLAAVSQAAVRLQRPSAAGLDILI